nr:MAG TPA: hypothetical protein [Caudoviricetes sp.]
MSVFLSVLSGYYPIFSIYSTILKDGATMSVPTPFDSS